MSRTPGPTSCGSRKPLVTAWYDKAGGKGARLSFLDPQTAIPGDPAGGIAWYKYHLYVADTLNGLRVFDMRSILDLNPDQNASVDDTTLDGLRSNVRGETRIGRQNNVYYGHTCRYVMPQVASYEFVRAQGNSPAATCVATGEPKASYISADRSDSAAPALIMGEYCDPDDTHPEKGRVGALPIDDATGLLKSTNGVVGATGAFHLPRDLTQGAARYDGMYYFNRSWTTHSGSLRRATVFEGRLVDHGANITYAVGPEDLSFEHGQGVPGGGTQYLWSLTEHRMDTTDPTCTDPGSPCGRVIYAHRVTDILARP
ncbi:hypothetical protein ACFXGI_02775 [Streptomyces sp. NPDC059355]|uniref:hypothetical protein n=1 Tax=Streptomyces sp. NPDC059355 TaxID=3346811 RepID=UPI0036786FB8